MSKEVDIEKRSPSPSDSEASLQSTVKRPRTVSWILVCIALYIGAFLYGLDTTISADVQGPIFEEFQQIEKLPWVGIGFPMGSVAVILLVGTMFAKFDIKWLIVGFFIAFEAGSALCGGAPNIDALIVGRVIAGIGGSGMYIGCLTYFSVFTTLRERPLYNALTGLAWGFGAILGPVIGGAFSVDQNATWRWAFYINLPIAGALAPAYVWLFPSHQPEPDLSVRTKFANIDWLGALLNAAFFVLLVVALTFSGSSWAWNSPGAIAVWVMFGVSAIAYALQQVFAIFTTPQHRIFPLHLLKSRTMVLLYLATACAASALSVCLYYTPLFFQFTKGDSALKAAVRLLPFIIPNIFAMMFNGALMPVVKRYTPWYFAAGILILVGGCLLFQVTPETHTAAIYGFEVLTGFGSGLVFQVAYSVAAAKLSGPDIAAGIGFFNVAQIGSISIALAIAGVVFQNVGFSNLKNALAGYNIPEEALRGALAGAESTLASASDSNVPMLVTRAVVKTISTEYALQIAAGALMVVTAALMRWEKIDLDVAAGA